MFVERTISTVKHISAVFCVILFMLKSLKLFVVLIHRNISVFKKRGNNSYYVFRLM